MKSCYNCAFFREHIEGWPPGCWAYAAVEIVNDDDAVTYSKECCEYRAENNELDNARCFQEAL